VRSLLSQKQRDNFIKPERHIEGATPTGMRTGPWNIPMR
jgi:hypothetical protein